MESIPANGRTYCNQASAHDYSRFLYVLWQDRLPFAEELREIMSLPNPYRIYQGVDSIPRTAKVYDKTGSTARLCGNMGIIEVPGIGGLRYPYTLISASSSAPPASGITSAGSPGGATPFAPSSSSCTRI